MKYLKQLALAVLIVVAPSISSAQGRGGPPGGIPGAFGAGPPGMGIGGRIGPPGMGAPVGPPGLGAPLGPSRRPLVPPGFEVRSAVRSLEHDLVGRPTDSKIVTPVLTRDPQGAMIVRNEILAVSPSDRSLEVAHSLNFSVVRQDRLSELGITSVTLRVPAGLSEAEALAKLRQADPGGSYDFAHIYNPTGEAAAPAAPSLVHSTVQASGVKIGMVDGGVESSHRALRDVSISSHTFARAGDGPPTMHGTAIASLLVGKDKEFSGYLPGAALYVADVFGGAVDGGSAQDIARALNWLASNRIAVTNISIAGPPNALLAAAVKGFLSGGHILVAPVGNDGPAAPPNYPAAYPGVVAVTSVDANGHLQIDANRGGANFAAIGVDVQAASLPQGYAKVTGTSYAAPAITARLGLLLKTPSDTGSKAALSQLVQRAIPVNAGERPLEYLTPPDYIGKISAAANPR